MEINMGSEHSGVEPTPLRKLLHVTAKTVDTTSLQALGRKLNTTQQLTFAKKYGKLLSLLEVDVQVEAVTALAQYYDPPLRCFTFQDFQLAPALEEFEQILGLPLGDKKPYRHIEHHASILTIADVLKVHPRELQEAQLNRNRTPGFARKYFEELMHRLAKKKEWEAFMDVLALTIYGVVMFPYVYDYVDFSAIDVFLAVKFASENPVPAVLADVYCTMDFCHERNGKRIVCCLPVLYVWLTTHIFNQTCKVDCPIVDWRIMQLKAKSRREWREYFASLDGKQIRWYPQWMKVTTIVYQCGSYPNVPLMGTRGCINYNPVMAQRQLAYPMMGPPAKELTSPLILYYADGSYTETIRKIRDAWERVGRKGKELGVRSFAAKESYYQWVKNRVAEIKLPFKNTTSHPIAESSTSNPVEDVEVTEMQARLTEMIEKNKKMEDELIKAHQAYATLKREQCEKERAFEEVCKKRKSELDRALKVEQCLGAANKELRMRVSERDTALTAKEHLKDLLVRTKRSEKEALDRMNGMQEEISKMKQQIKEMVVACEAEINVEKEKVIEVLKEYEASVKEMDGQLEKKDKDIEHWMKRFAKLACLANGVIDDLPYELAKAEVAMHPFDTPEEIRAFINSCKERISQMKRMIVRAREG